MADYLLSWPRGWFLGDQGGLILVAGPLQKSVDHGGEECPLGRHLVSLQSSATAELIRNQGITSLKIKAFKLLKLIFLLRGNIIHPVI